ncbi:hypothetical protein [Bathymodiolus japonicus methanotrophic gill symbiont]|uniref:hypothetical protein n=1 Tax=Bathymodiolus japonicus methanotrophic gill symbiont TaxID=113269 RepID=UPI001C8E2BB6|nr:hypothetical protein [Bathymodiolus japonicus methanotrophic gill symbiont]
MLRIAVAAKTVADIINAPEKKLKRPVINNSPAKISFCKSVIAYTPVSLSI